MSGFTDAERRGARLLAILLVLGTLSDLYRARQPEVASPLVTRAEPGAYAGTPGIESSAPADPGPGAPAGLDLNRASAAELDRLPGIGPVLAARIVEQRRLHGPFHSVDELRAVPGIGPRLLERLRPVLRVRTE